MFTYDTHIWSYTNVPNAHMWACRMFIYEHCQCSYMIKLDDHIRSVYDHIRTVIYEHVVHLCSYMSSHMSMHVYELTYDPVYQWDDFKHKQNQNKRNSVVQHFGSTHSGSHHSSLIINQSNSNQNHMKSKINKSTSK